MVAVKGLYHMGINNMAYAGIDPALALGHFFADPLHDSFLNVFSCQESKQATCILGADKIAIPQLVGKVLAFSDIQCPVMDPSGYGLQSIYIMLNTGTEMAIITMAADFGQQIGICKQNLLPDIDRIDVLHVKTGFGNG